MKYETLRKIEQFDIVTPDLPWRNALINFVNQSQL